MGGNADGGLKVNASRTVVLVGDPVEQLDSFGGALLGVHGLRQAYGEAEEQKQFVTQHGVSASDLMSWY